MAVSQRETLHSTLEFLLTSQAHLASPFLPQLHPALFEAFGALRLTPSFVEAIVCPILPSLLLLFPGFLLLLSIPSFLYER